MGSPFLAFQWSRQAGSDLILAFSSQVRVDVLHDRRFNPGLSEALIRYFLCGHFRFLVDLLDRSAPSALTTNYLDLLCQNRVSEPQFSSFISLFFSLIILIFTRSINLTCVHCSKGCWCCIDRGWDWENKCQPQWSRCTTERSIFLMNRIRRVFLVRRLFFLLLLLLLGGVFGNESEGEVHGSVRGRWEGAMVRGRVLLFLHEFLLDCCSYCGWLLFLDRIARRLWLDSCLDSNNTLEFFLFRHDCRCGRWSW